MNEWPSSNSQVAVVVVSLDYDAPDILRQFLLDEPVDVWFHSTTSGRSADSSSPARSPLKDLRSNIGKYQWWLIVMNLDNGQSD